jgi:aminopeptidase N
MKTSRFAAAFIISFLTITQVRSQVISTAQNADVYHGTATKDFDLIHTVLDVSFNFHQRSLIGKEWVTLTPHLYPQITVKLDAKGMKIKSLGIVQNQKVLPLPYTYDSLYLDIKLKQLYKKGEKITLFISYETLPDVKLAKGKYALTFINPDESKSGKPTQVWNFGEPENNSSWFPTIDKPNQKTTQDISLTVPVTYTTLSNGALKSQKVNKDGTRTDRWVMDLPHAPYLFMLAVGKFSIVKDSWHGKEVSYYVEPQFAKNARSMFLNTVEAIGYFSKVTGVPYPWNKYSQVKLYDYPGAMEHTTASSFGDNGQNSLKELADRNYDSGNIHELFHQWFGDYVTAESWANITLNESFADLGEILWAEHKYGADVADDHLQAGLKGYLNNADGWKKPLVRYHYDDEQDVFDGISYQKGGRILNMLRHYIGNDAFYKGLNIYLKTNAYKSVEVNQLRLALEEASGLDLNWFFDQWFFGAGHPLLTINYAWDESLKTQYVYITQTQERRLFTLPVAIDIYANGKTQRHKVWLRGKVDTLSFKLDEKPDLVNMDAEKILVAGKTDNKSLKEFAFQYKNAPLYMDRYEAIEAAAAQQNDSDAQTILSAALKNKYYGIRMKAATAVDLKNEAIKKLVIPSLIQLSAKEPNNSTRAETIKILGRLNDPRYTSIFSDAMQSSSYTVQGEALYALGSVDKNLQFLLAKKHEADSKGKLQEAILVAYINLGNDKEWSFVYHRFVDGNSPVRYAFTRQFADMTSRVDNPAYAQQGIIAIKNLVLIEGKVATAPRIIVLLNQIKAQRDKMNDKASMKVVDNAIAEINAKVH